MAVSKLLQSNFAAGELGPRIIASGDLERYAAGAARLSNTIILPLGAAERRSGSIWVEDPKDVGANGRLLPFIREIGDAVAVVVQSEVLRFIDARARAYITDGAGDPIEIACPWVDADYPHLFTWQSVDVVWIGDRRGVRPVKVLQRNAGVWQALVDLETRMGPWLPRVNASVGVSKLSGTDAEQNMFGEQFIGAQVMVGENSGVPGTMRWLANETVNAGDCRYNAGRVYRATIGGASGTNGPIHDSGIVTDGKVTWLYLHDGLGVIRITSPSTCDVVAFLPRAHAIDTVPFTGEYYAHCAFSPFMGWPRAGTIFHERMALAGSNAAPDNIYLSRVGMYGPFYGDFKPGLGTGLVVDSDAVRRGLNTEQVQPILHLLAFERLYAFTAKGVHIITGPSLDEPITPDGASARSRSGYGASANVAPIKAGDNIVYVTTGGEELREIVPETRDTPNLSILVHHIAGRGFAELAFALAPTPLIWSRLNDGGLASLTYEPLERVRAWAQQRIGGRAFVTSAIVMPDENGRDELWLYLRRQIDGAVRYSIEVMPGPWSRYRDPLERCCAVDAAGYFDFWNADPSNRARLTIIDAEQRAVRVEMEADVFSGNDLDRRFALRLAEPENGFDPGQAARIARIDIRAVIDARTIEGRLVTPGADGLPGAWSMHWALMARELTIGPRLEGQVCDALFDGVAQTGMTVEGGKVTLREPAARGWIGLPCPFEIVDLPVAFGSPLGAAFGGPKKIERLWVVVEHASPGAVAFNPENDGGETRLFQRPSDAPPDRAVLELEGYYEALPDGAWSAKGQIGIRQAAPYPFTVLGIVKQVQQ